ncbi:MAG TPA: ROK family transcriptional regulator, partial [Tissierellaceae bacterium]|nr:ROK family transcriptional regulator [Tissierellaceae bacterium]
MSEIVKHDQGLMRKSNKILILNLIREKRPISRAELAKITGMSPTSVSRIVSKLMEFGLIEETKLTSNGVGRKASLLDTSELSACSISIYLDLDSCIIGIVDFDGNLLKEERLTYDTENLIWTDIMNRVCETVKEMVKATAADHIKIVGLGVAVPGIVDTHRGVVVFSPQLGWTGVNLKKYLEEELGYRVVIENAIKSKALAEGIYGGAKDSSSAVYINFGSGVGSALITEDEIFRGTTNSAGEVG